MGIGGISTAVRVMTSSGSCVRGVRIISNPALIASSSTTLSLACVLVTRGVLEVELCDDAFLSFDSFEEVDDEVEETKEEEWEWVEEEGEGGEGEEEEEEEEDKEDFLLLLLVVWGREPEEDPERGGMGFIVAGVIE